MNHTEHRWTANARNVPGDGRERRRLTGRFALPCLEFVWGGRGSRRAGASGRGKSRFGSIRAVGLVLLGVFLASCTTPPGAGEVRFHNWWNYYEYGVQQLKAGAVGPAHLAFEQCLGLKPGAKFGFDEDLWRARTYGLHFIEGFFPNRELGVCLYEEGRTDEAVTFLLKSMKQCPSGRAKHYLNLARKRQLASRAVPIPMIALSPESEKTWTRERERLLAGVVRAQGRVARAVINGQPEFIELAEEARTFEKSLVLKPGPNTVTVEAVDLLGQGGVRQVNWILDVQPPQLVLKQIERRGREWAVEGVCLDDAGLASVSIGGERVGTGGVDAPRRSVPVKFTLKADMPLRFVATDLAGNELATVLTQESLEAPLPDAAALSDRALAAVPEDAGVMSDVPGAICQAETAAPSGDRMKPSLELRGIRKTIIVFHEDLFLDGTAKDPGKLKSVTVNGEELLAAEAMGGQQSYFCRNLPLDVGSNLFEVVATDMAGNRNIQAFTAIRKDPEYMSANFRLAVGVSPLAAEEKIAQSADVRQLSDEVRRLMEMAIMERDPARFNLLERDENWWDKVLVELKLATSELANPNAALKIGKMLPAELLFMARFLPENPGYTVHAQVVEVATGRLRLSDDVYCRQTDRDTKRFTVDGLVDKIQRRFPVVSGTVLSASAEEAMLSVGADQGVELGTRFVVIRKEGDPPDIKSGEVRKQGERFIELDVTRVKPSTAVARVLPSVAGDTVKGGDYVYAR